MLFIAVEREVVTGLVCLVVRVVVVDLLAQMDLEEMEVVGLTHPYQVAGVVVVQMDFYRPLVNLLLLIWREVVMVVKARWERVLVKEALK
jgi:hypothetical protein